MLIHMFIHRSKTARKRAFDCHLSPDWQQMATEMKKVNKQCLLDTPRTVRVREKTCQVIVQTSRL